MDKQSNSTAVPQISTLVAGTEKTESAHHLAATDFHSLSMKDLRSILDLFSAVDETVCAFLNQDRFANEHRYNAAGEIGDGLLDHLSWCISLIEQVAKDARPTTAEEAEHRAWLLIKRAANYSENLTRFVAASAQLSVSVMELEGA